jgi:small subunit ribosomal protein S4
LQVEDLLKRRLPSIIFKRNLAATPQQARQFVTHKKVRIAGNVVNIPSYLVATAEEAAIQVDKIKTQEMAEAEKAEAKEAAAEETK